MSASSSNLCVSRDINIPSDSAGAWTLRAREPICPAEESPCPRQNIAALPVFLFPASLSSPLLTTTSSLCLHDYIHSTTPAPSAELALLPSHETEGHTDLWRFDVETGDISRVPVTTSLYVAVFLCKGIPREEIQQSPPPCRSPEQQTRK